MVYRYFIQLYYDGSPFHGWQIQPNAKSIQQFLNEALSTVTRSEIYTIGCGRTDAGVHATKFFAHFNFEQELHHLEDLSFRVNCILPKEIAIQRIFPVNEDVHSRFSAVSRTYEYLIAIKKNPFYRNRAYEYREPLDIELMNEAGLMLNRFEDFTSFAKLHSDSETNLCQLEHAIWTGHDEFLRFEIKANRFLRNMVRAVVGTMIELGRGKISLSDFEAIIEAKDRSAAGYSVPAHGLYLIDIEYPKGAFKHE